MTPPGGADPRALWCAGLVDRLRFEGFDIGLGQCLLVERLLDRIGPSSRAQELKTVLAPIFARNPEEQNRFYDVFDEYLGAEATRVLVGEASSDAFTPRASRRLKQVEIPVPPRVRWWRRREPWVAVALVLVAAGLIWLPRFWSDGAKVKPDTTGGTKVDTAAVAGTVVDPVVVKPLDVVVGRRAEGGADRGMIRIAIAALPFLALAGYEWWRRRRQQAIAERELKATAPHAWPIRIPAATTGLFPTSDFAATGRALRRRQPGAEMQLSVGRTVAATVRALGFPTIQYEPVTRPAEYTALIERTSPRDHQARYFGGLIDRLSADGAFIKAYYFENDPRVCFEESVLKGVRLADLMRERDGDRLLVFADGYSFLHPTTGLPLPWIELLEGWSDKALLTPVTPRRWGRREAMLRRCFDVFPSTLEGIRGAVDHFEIDTRPDLARWKERDRSRAPGPIGPSSSAGELKEALGADRFRWVAACAVYPELHWELTALLGGLGEVGTGVLTEANVLRIIRLPWFRDGLMPEGLRRDLLDELAKMDQGSGTETEAAVRQTIARILEREPVDPESVAGHARRRELLQQQLYLYRENPPARRAALSRLRREVAEDDLLHDVTVARLLERATPNRLAFQLPDWFRARLWQGGFRALGVTRLAATAGAAVAALGLWTFLPRREPGAGSMLATAAVYPELRSVSGVVGETLTVRSAADTAGRIGWVSSDPAVASIDTAGGLSLAKLGSATLEPGPGFAGPAIRVEVRLPPAMNAQESQPKLAVLRIAWAMPVGTRTAGPRGAQAAFGGSLGLRNSGPGQATISSCDSTIATAAGTSIQARSAGSTVLIEQGPDLIAVRALHVVPRSDTGSEQRIEAPIDPLPPVGSVAYDSAVRAKAADFSKLLRADPSRRLAITFYFVGGRYGAIDSVMHFADQRGQSGAAADPQRRVDSLRSEFAQAKVGADRLVLRTIVSPLDCGGASLGPAVRDGDLDRIDFALARDTTPTNRARSSSRTVGSATVPDLRGLRPDEARRALETAGLRLDEKVDSVKRSPNDPYQTQARSGTVIRQSPPGGARAPAGAAVHISVTVDAAASPGAAPDNRAFAERVLSSLNLKYSPGQIDQAVAELEKGLPRLELLRQVAQRTDAFQGDPVDFLRRSFRAAVCRDPTDPELKELMVRLGRLPTPKTIMDLVLGSKEALAARARCVGSPPARAS